MNKLNGNIFFIDRVNYDLLNKVHGSINNISDIYNKTDKISDLTYGYLMYQNLKLTNLFYFCNMSTIENTTDSDLNYIIKDFKYRMSLDDTDATIEEKYYDLYVLQDGTILIVVKKGFLEIMMESKSSLIDFTLECLHLIDNYGYNSNSYTIDNINKIIESYLLLKNNDSYFNLVKIRCS